VQAVDFTHGQSFGEAQGFSDIEEKENPLGDLASQTLRKLRDSIRCLSAVIAPVGTDKS
jgi:hypothetical protein